MTAFEARIGFGKLLDRVSREEEVVITRYGRPVARLIRERTPELKDVRKAVKALRLLRDKILARQRPHGLSSYS